MYIHLSNDCKDGRETNPVISEILGEMPKEDAETEIAFQTYCSKLGIIVGSKGAFGRKRKFWKMF